MSLVLELLKSGAVKANAIVVNPGQTAPEVRLSPGDLLKLPAGEGVQTLRQGQDLVILIDALDGQPPQRVLVRGFFAANALGMVQVGDDGNATMITPRSLVGTTGTATPTAEPATPATPGDTTPDPASDASSTFVTLLANQAFADLAVSDAAGDSVQGGSTLTTGADPAGLGGLLSSLITPLAGVDLGVLSGPSPLERPEANTALRAGVQPQLTSQSTGYINAANRLSGYPIEGTGQDGQTLTLTLVGSSSTLVLRTTVAGGTWGFTLSAEQIDALGQGPLAVTAQHVSSAGQNFGPAWSQVLTIDTVLPNPAVVSTDPQFFEPGNAIINYADTQSALKLTIKGEPGAALTLTLTDSKGQRYTLQAQDHGKQVAPGVWELDIAPTLTALDASGKRSFPDGTVSYQVTSTDAAGNSSDSNVGSFALHQTVPISPTADLVNEDDTGYDTTTQADKITNVQTPRFSGTAQDGTTVLVYRDINGDGVAAPDERVDAVAVSAGSFAFTSANLGRDAGQQTFLFVAQDAWGNRSAAKAVSVTIDSTANAPTLDAVSTDNAISDDEALAATLPFSGTGEAGAQVVLTLSADGKQWALPPVIVDASGKWRIEVPATSATTGADAPPSLRSTFGPTDFTALQVSVQQTDRAGNVSVPLETSINLRTTPVAQVSNFALLAADDTGSSSSDGITQNRTLGLSGKAEPGRTVEFYLDTNGDGNIDAADTRLGAVEVGAASGSNTLGDFVYTVRLPADGSYKVLTQVVDTRTNSRSPSTNIGTGALSITVDSSIVDTRLDTIGGKAAQGRTVTVVPGDFVGDTVEFVGTGEKGATVNLVFEAGSARNESHRGIEVDANGQWRATLSRSEITNLGSSVSIALTVSQTDTAGNTSTPQTQTFNTLLQPLFAPTGLALSSGQVTSDASTPTPYTSNTQGLRFTGTSRAEYNGYTVTLVNDANLNGATDANEVLGTATVVNGAFVVDNVALAPGNYQYLRAVVTSPEGATSGLGAAYRLVVDNACAAPSGLSATADNIFNFAESDRGTAVFSGSAEALSAVVVQVLVHRPGGSEVVYSSFDLKAAANGSWSVGLNAAQIAELDTLRNSVGGSTVSFRAKATDLANNTSVWSANQRFDIDTIAPNGIDATRVSSAVGFNTQNSWVIDSKLISNPFLDGEIKWSEVYDYVNGQAVLKGTVAKVAVALLADVKVGDTVTLSWSGQTVQRPVTEADVTAGYAVMDITGTMVLAQRQRNPASTNTVSVSATFTDVAGNTSDSIAVPLNLNGTSTVIASLANAAPTLRVQSDSFASVDANGVYYSRNAIDGNNTALRTFTVTGVVAAGDTVRIFNGNTELFQVDSNGNPLPIVANASGNYQANLALAGNTTYQLTAQSSSPTPSNVLAVVVDIAPPAAPTVEPLAAASDTYINAAERDAGVPIRGKAEPFATVHIVLRNLDTGVASSRLAVPVDQDGNWQAVLGVVLWGQVGDGHIAYAVTQTDRAGNTSTAHTVAGTLPTVLFDSVAELPRIDSMGTTAGGVDYLNSSLLRAGQGLTITGVGEPKGTLHLTVGNLTKTVTVRDNGTWSVPISPAELAAFPEGPLYVAATLTDLAGNVSASAANRTVVKDTLAGTPTMADVASDNTITASERDQGVLISGAGAEAGASIVLQLQGSNGVRTEIKTTATSTGTWSVVLSTTQVDDLGQGAATATVTQTDRAGNTSSPATRSLSVATVPLGAVVVNPLSGDDIITEQERNAGVTMSGTVPSGTVLKLKLQGLAGTLEPAQSAFSLGNVDANGNVTWSLNLSRDQLNALGLGEVQVSAYASTADGKQSSPLTQTKFTIENDEPSPTLSPVANDGFVNSKEVEASASASGGLMLEGGGKAGHTVKLRISNDNRVSLSERTVTVGADGKWSIPLDSNDLNALGSTAAAGVGVTIRATQSGPGLSGTTLTSVEVSSSFTIDTQAPTAPSTSGLAQANLYNVNNSAVAGGISVAEALAGVTIAVALPTNLQASDTITLQWGAVAYAVKVTPDMVGKLFATIAIPTATIAQQGSGQFDVTAQVSDAASNLGPVQTVLSQLVVVAPPQAPTFDTLAFVNEDDFNALPVAGQTVSGTAAEGGTVAVFINSSSYPAGYAFSAVQVNAGKWSVALTRAQLKTLGEGSITAVATYTDARGNVSASTTQRFVLDLTDPTVPAADSAAQTAADIYNATSALAGGLIRNKDAATGQERETEAAQSVQVAVALGSDVQAGDKLALLWGGQTLNTTVTSGDLNRSAVLTPGGQPQPVRYVLVTVNAATMTAQGDADLLSVTAQVTDRAGNAGAAYNVWTGKVDALPQPATVDTVSVDSFVNAQESAAWAVSGTGLKDTTVLVTITGASGQQVTSAALGQPGARVVGANGVWTFALSAADVATLGQGLATVQVVQYDSTGNPSVAVGKTFTIDTVAPSLERASINTITADGTVTFAEKELGFGISGTGEPGSTVKVRITNPGGSISNTVATTAAVDDFGNWSLALKADDFTGLASGTGLQVVATLTDAAGNQSQPFSRAFDYESQPVVPPAFASISGITAGSDFAFNATDLAAAKAGATHKGFTITGTVAAAIGTVKVFITATVTVGTSTSTKTFEATIQAGEGSTSSSNWSRTFTDDELAGLQGKVVFSAVSTVGRGQSLPVTFDSGAIDQSKAITIDTTPPTLLTASISGLDGRTGVAKPVAVKADDLVVVSLQASEAVSLASGTVPTLTIRLADNSTRIATYDATRSTATSLVFTYKVQLGDNAAGITGIETLTGATAVDAGGNSLNTILPAASATLRLDTTKPLRPTLSDPLAMDVSSLGGTYINLAEADAGFTVKVSLANTNALVGDSVVLWWLPIADGSRIDIQQPITSTDFGSGFVEVNVTKSGLGSVQGAYRLRALVMDAAGNTSDVSSTNVVPNLDTIAPVALTTDTWAGDNNISAAEAERFNTNSSLGFLGALTGKGIETQTKAVSVVITQGDTKSITLAPTFSTTSGTWSVSAQDMANAVKGLVDGEFKVTTFQTDVAGNPGPSSSSTYYMDRQPPGAPTSVNVPLAQNDGWLNLADAQKLVVNVDIAGSGAKAGDRLVISGLQSAFSYILTQAEADAAAAAGASVPKGVYTIAVSVPAQYVQQAAGTASYENVTLSVTIVDRGGNTSGVASDQPFKLDTIITAPQVDATQGAAKGVTAAGAKTGVSFYGTGEPDATVTLQFDGASGSRRFAYAKVDANGNFEVKLTSSDFADLGSGAVSYTLFQTDLAGNKSSTTSGGFDVALSVQPPTLLNISGDNMVQATEATGVMSYTGQGLANATVQVAFQVRNASGTYDNVLTLADRPTVDSSGNWSIELTDANLTALAGTSGQATVRMVATQTFNGDTSSATTLDFYIDKSPPTAATTSAIVTFDANGDGANNDGLEIKFSEPVAVADLLKPGFYTASNGKSLGTGFRIEAMDSAMVNGTSYATTFRLFLGTGANLAPPDTITVPAANVKDTAGNTAASNVSFTVPSLEVPAAPVPQLNIAGDNLVSDSEKSSTTTLDYTFTALAGAGTITLYRNGVAIKSISLNAGDTTASFSLIGADWGTEDGTQSLTAQIKTTATGASSMFSSPKAVQVDTAIAQGLQRVEVVADGGTPGQADAGDKVRVSFNEAVDLSAAVLPADVFGSGATVAIVGGVNGKSAVWDITLGSGASIGNITSATNLTFANVSDVAGNTGSLTGTVNTNPFAAPGVPGVNNTIKPSSTAAPTQTASIDSANDNVGTNGTSGSVTGSIAAATGTTTITTDDATPTLAGTLSGALTSSQTVAVYDSFNGAATPVRIGYATVSGTGWTFTPSTALSSGNHSFTVRVEDYASGTQGPASSAYAFNINALQSITLSDNVGMTPGAVTGIGTGIISSGSTSDDATPTLSGRVAASLAAGEDIGIFARLGTGAFVKVGATTPGADGTWTAADINLSAVGTANGSYTLFAMVEQVGNTSATAGRVVSAHMTYTRNTDTPATTHTASITRITDDTYMNGSAGAPRTGGNLITDRTGAISNDDTTPTLTGTLSAALITGGTQVVAIYDTVGGVTTRLGTATVTGTNWTFTPSTPLPTGSHSFTAYVESANGGLAARGNTVANSTFVDTINSLSAITVTDTTGPVQGVITSYPTTPPTGVRYVMLRANNTNQSMVVAELEIYAGGVNVANVANNAGVVVKASDPGLGSFTLSRLTNGTSGDIPYLTGNNPDIWVQVDLGQVYAVDSIKFIGNGSTGTGMNNISVFASTNTMLNAGGTALVAPYTSYTAMLSNTGGVYNLGTTSGATATNAAFSQTFGVNGTPAITDDLRPQLSGTLALALTGTEQIGVYDRVGTTLTKLGIATVSGTGWSFKPSSDLAAGQHNFIVMLEPVGNLGTSGVVAAGTLSGGRVVSAPIVVNLSATPLTNPVNATVTIVGVNDDAGINGSSTGNFSAGVVNNTATNSRTLDDTTPTVLLTVTGLAAGQVVAVYDGSTRLGFATQSSGTTWTHTFTTPALALGSRSLTAQVEDPATGVRGPASSAVVLTLNAMGAVSLVDDVGAVQGTIASNTATDDARPVISGTLAVAQDFSLNAGATGECVGVYDTYNGVTTRIGTATVSGNAWTFTPTTDLGNGLHSITAVVESNTNTSLANGRAIATPTVFTVDTVVPSAQIVSLGDNVINTAERAVKQDITVTLTKAQAGDVVGLFMDGVQVGTVTLQVGSTGTASFSIAANGWGADGQRTLTTKITRGSTEIASDARTIYVNADQVHWSQVNAGTLWFDPDTISQPMGSQVMEWKASAGTTAAGGQLSVYASTGRGTVVLNKDASGHNMLYFNGSSSLNSNAVIAIPTFGLNNGYSDFSMFKRIVAVNTWAYTMTRLVEYQPQTGPAKLYRHHFGTARGFIGEENNKVDAPGVTSAYSGDNTGFSNTTPLNSTTINNWMALNGGSNNRIQTVAVDGRTLATRNVTTGDIAASGNYVPTGSTALIIGGTDVPDQFIIAMLADQIAFNTTITAAQSQEVATYLAGKYQSVGSQSQAKNAAGVYDRGTSANASALVDDMLQLNVGSLGVGNDTVIVGGADYVTTGAGQDKVVLNDLAFRHLDGGLGHDTLALSTSYSGTSNIVLADFVSNARGTSSDTAANTRVNAAGFHGLYGFETIDLRQTGATAAGKPQQTLTVDAADVRQLSETKQLLVYLGAQDVLKVNNFSNSAGARGVYKVLDSSGAVHWMDTLYATNGSDATLYSSGGDSAPEVNGVSFNAATGTVRLRMDHAMNGSYALQNFEVTDLASGSTVRVGSVSSFNQNQDILLGLQGASGSAALPGAPIKINFTGSSSTLFDQYGRGFGNTTWVVGTDGGDSIDAANQTVSQGRGVTILGGAGADGIIGTSGADIIVGGLGADLLTGGKGSDLFVYRNETSGAGGAAGLGGRTGDEITDFTFNDKDPTNNDRLDLSQLFDYSTSPSNTITYSDTATAQAQKLTNGGFMQVIKTDGDNSTFTIEIQVDRDGGGLYGSLLKLTNVALPTDYLTITNSQDLLQKLIEEGRLLVAHA